MQYGPLELQRVRRVKRAKFFRCQDGHAESYLGEDDGQGIPWRPCKVCHKPMRLVEAHILDGKLVGEQAVLDAKRLKPGVTDRYNRTNKVRMVKPGTLLKRLLKRLPQFEVIGQKHRIVTDVEVKIGHKGDTGVGGLERMHLVLLIDEQHQVYIEAVGAFGWAQEVKEVLKRKCRASVPQMTYRKCMPVPAVVKKARPVKKSKPEKKVKAKKVKKVVKTDPFVKLMRSCAEVIK